MARSNLYVDALVKNAELKNLAEFLHKCSFNTAREQSGGQQAGLDQHALQRQAAYIANARQRLAGIRNQPEPDHPASHPNDLEVKFQEPEFLTDEGVAINQDAEGVSLLWQTLAYEVTHSASAKKGGSMTAADAGRCEANINALEQHLIGIAGAKDLDFPETAADAASE